jgi:chromosome segregation ATPase
MSKFEDLLDTDNFSIAKIDETIARSKRIVQESLAISKNSCKISKLPEKDISFSSSHSNNESFDQDLKQNPFSENSFKIKTNSKFQKVLLDNLSLLKELESQEQFRQKEIERLEGVLSGIQSPALSEINEILRQKQEKIQELQEKIKNSPVYRENQEIKEKIRKNQGINTEANLLSEILFERKAKEELENKYAELYSTYQENSKNTGKQVQKIRDDIKTRQSENEKTITFLKRKLEEKILDNRLLIDQFKVNKRKSSREVEESSKSFQDKITRRFSSNDQECQYFEFNKKIQKLEAEVKKYKQKYQNLKKSLNKKNRRCASIEAKKQKENLDKSRKNIKKKVILRGNERGSLGRRKNHTPLATPH